MSRSPNCTLKNPMPLVGGSRIGWRKAKVYLFFFNRLPSFINLVWCINVYVRMTVHTTVSGFVGVAML